MNLVKLLMHMSVEDKPLAPCKVHFLNLYNTDQISEYWAALSLSLISYCAHYIDIHDSICSVLKCYFI